jgi:hypothetical protein
MMKRKTLSPSKFYVYVICYAGKYHEVGIFPAGRIEALGGRKKFELQLSRDTSWFHPIGEIDSWPDRTGDTPLDVAPIKRLLRAWMRSGSPKTIGKVENDDHCNDRA